MKKRSTASSRTRASSDKPAPGAGTDPGAAAEQGVRYAVVKVHYHKLHSILPREAVLLEPVEGPTFATYEEAADRCRKLTVGGEYSFAPMKVKKS